MHNTAMTIGKIFFDQYWEDNFSVVVELGSYDFNGTLRKFQPADSFWIGLDVEPGPSVNVCVKPGAALPIADESTNVVLATSVFEHDELFWLTFIDLCRITKPGGFIYINAPSNGGYHRYPQDCWRFYPDASRALEKWARFQGVEISLLESFVANRHADVWNDFVAIFGKEPVAPRPDTRFVYSRVSCRNVHRVGEHSILLHQNTTEDMDLINDYADTISRLDLESEANTASEPAAGSSPGALLPRLFTTHRTVLYIDPASGELRHGPLGSSPANARFSADGAHGVIMHEAAGALRPIACLVGCEKTIDSASKDDAHGAATMFETIQLRGKWIGLRASGLFLCAEPDGQVTLSRKLCNAWESFLLVPLTPTNTGRLQGEPAANWNRGP